MSTTTLRITEIFYSLQGEARDVGWPTVFVRLTGCPLRCQYCDTEYAFHGGQTQTLTQILAAVAAHPAQHVCVTGGEPLAQKNCPVLLTALCDAGYQVSLETSGALDISAVDPRVSRVMDIKTPASNEASKNRWENLQHLTQHDQIKFVICSRSDYDWAKNTLDEYALTTKCDVLFSPSYTELESTTLAAWILDDGLPVRFQRQLHKQLWGEKTGC